MPLFSMQPTERLGFAVKQHMVHYYNRVLELIGSVHSMLLYCNHARTKFCMNNLQGLIFEWTFNLMLCLIFHWISVAFFVDISDGFRDALHLMSQWTG